MTRPTPPSEILTFATMMRANFGTGVRLKYWNDGKGNGEGNPGYDIDGEVLGRRVEASPPRTP